MQHDLRHFQPGPVRVAVLGTHAVGKTSFATALAAELDLPAVLDQEREAARAMGVTPATVPLDRFCEYQRRALEQQYASECLAERGFVSDQSVYNYGTYFDNPPNEALRNSTEYIKVQDIYRNLIKLRAFTYSFIVYIPKMFELIQDDERHGEITFQNKIQSDIETKVLPLIYRISTQAESEIPVCRLQSDGPQARVAEVLEWVASIKERKP